MPTQLRLPSASLCVVLFLALATHAHSQLSDTITANPNAVKLRRIWLIVGKIEQDHIGSAGGGIPDINGDGLAEIAIYLTPQGSDRQWRVYNGGSPSPDTTADWIFFGGNPWLHNPVVGDFWGDGRRSVIIGDEVRLDTLQTTWFLKRMLLFRVDSTRLPLEPTFIQPLGVTTCMKDALACDLDGDGADELIVAEACDATTVKITRTLIYKGGPAFQLDTPTVVVDDGELNQSSNYYLRVGNLDGDEYPDMVTGGFYPEGAKLKFWWGRTGSPWNWGKPDRVILLSTLGHPRIGYGLIVFDCDGDSVLDYWLPGPDGHVYLYRSVTRSIRYRPLDLGDADGDFYLQDFTVPDRLGYLNDSLGLYEMGGVYGPAPNSGGALLLGLSGGAAGPDHSFDAHHGAKEDGLGVDNIFAITSPIPDCNGDGWDDFFAGNFNYGGFNKGIALVLAGGPYIPRDDPNTSVEEIAVAGKERAISVWPNPAREELNIAWRGDLRPMPGRFAVHTLSGELVARGEVESHLGAAVWRCEGAPAGVYLLSVYGADGGVIATIRVVRE